MQICGLQKLTLLDFPGRTACTVFCGGCNLRCPFCHNASLVLRPGEAPSLPVSELYALLDKRRGVLDGVCVTGGEPLLQPDAAELLRAIKDRGFLVKLDTNGFFPAALERIVQEGLADYVAMDLKNGPSAYARTVGVPGLDLGPLRESIAFLRSGAVDYEFRTTVVRGLHTAQSLAEAAALIEGAPRWYLQAFVDSGELVAPAGLSAFTPEEMRAYLALVRPHVREAGLRGV